MTSLIKGQRHSNGQTTVSVHDDRETRELRNVYPNKSKTFEWGYAGSGPTCLAAALCFEATGELAALSLVHFIKVELVEPLEEDSWEIPITRILDSISRAKSNAGLFEPGKGHYGERSDG